MIRLLVIITISTSIKYWKNGMLSRVGFFMAAPPGSVQLGNFLDYGRKNLSEDGHCLLDATCALCDTSWEGAVDSSLFCLCPVHAFHPRSMSRDFLEDWLLTYPGSRVRISRHPMMWPLEHQRITLSKCSQCQSGDTCSLDCMACCLSPKHCQGWNLIKW